MRRNEKGITLIALIITIIVILILAGVTINTLYGNNGIISNTQDVATLANIKNLEEGIDLYKVNKNIEGKIEEESYPLALNEDGSKITLSQMRNANELSKLPDEVKYTLLNLCTEKGSTNIPTLDKIDYTKFYKLDYTELSISKEEAENLVIYIDGDDYKVINLNGVKYQRNNVYVIIPLNNEAEPEYITVANNTYKLYGDGTLKALGEKTVNAGYTSSEVSAINNSWDEFDLKAINARFNNRMNLPTTLTEDWYASHVYFSTGTAYVIDENSDLWAWGANYYNKLGLGHSFLVVEPTKILEGRCEGKENVKADKVWAGSFNTFVVDKEGILWACGSNGYGTLGQGNKKVYNNWVQINYINGNNVKEIQVSSSGQHSAALIIMENGTVYVAGNSTTLGKSGNKFNFIEINEYKNAKQIQVGNLVTWFIDSNDVLYACGFSGSLSTDKNITASNAIKIFENVKKVNLSGDLATFVTKENKLYIARNNKNQTLISNVNITDTDNIELVYGGFILNGNLYNLNEGGGYANKLVENVKAYCNNYDNYEFIQNKITNVYIKNNKVYVRNQPNITKLGEKSNYNLRKVFENATFVQGKGNNISIVDRNGKVYESVTSKANEKIENVKKIIASNSTKYAIGNDGTLFVKGNWIIGMCGGIEKQSGFVQVTNNESIAFTNVRDIFTSTKGGSAIFTTDDNKVYWAGAKAYILLPGIKGDYFNEKEGWTTSYSQEVKSIELDKIKNKIKDIEYSFINEGGVEGKITLILTEDGKLYTMANNKNMSGNNTATSEENGDFAELTIKEGTIVKQVLTQDGLSLALLSNGEVYGWGYNTYGILGSNYKVGGIYPTPVKLEGLPANIRYMSLGNGFAIFASKSGEVYGIGKNDYGQLGTGDSVGRTEFVRCSNLEE